MKKKIGIWGLGLVGKSVISYLCNKNYNLEILENRELNTIEKKFLQDTKSSLNKNIDNFFINNNFIVPSPGIDIDKYKKKYSHKFLSELDIFSQALEFYKNIKTIAITGTLGKTSVTYLLDKILTKLNQKVLTGGNIGIPMLSLLDKINNKNLILLELSSFQLELSNKFAPDIAIITNFYSNHLDRHKTVSKYFNAKLNILKKQNNNQIALMPLNLAKKIKAQNINSKLCFFSKKEPSNKKLDLLKNFGVIYFIKNQDIYKIYKLNNNIIKDKILNINNFNFNISFVENWLIIIAICDMLNLNISNLSNIKLDLPNHRLELITNHNNIYFYNDSKSTLPEATLAAINTLRDKLNNKKIILFLGGLSKGVNRESLIKKLKDKVEYTICFGQEAKILKELCDLNNIKAAYFNNLEDAFSFCLTITKPNNIVLFSPSGSSFDLFKDYQDRGNQFKALVNKFIKK